MSSQEILAGLRKDALANAGDLPGSQEWARKFFNCEKIELDPGKPFINQINAASGRDDVALSGESVHWDPYEEGYDEGPGDLSDSWHTRGRISTGQYRGTVVDDVPDELSAIMTAAICDGVDDDEAHRRTVDLLSEKWVAPVSQDKRDAKAVKSILNEWKRLSPEARTALLKELAVSK